MSGTNALVHWLKLEVELNKAGSSGGDGARLGVTTMLCWWLFGKVPPNFDSQAGDVFLKALKSVFCSAKSAWPDSLSNVSHL